MLATTAFIVVGLFVCLAAASILLRKAEVEFELVPNQLITRKPLVFMSGDRSIFYFTRYWNQIPSFLTEHGFEVYKAPLPWKKGPARLNRIQAIFKSWEQQKFTCHLFVDPSIYQEVSTIIDQHPSFSITSLNLVCADAELALQDPAKLKSPPIAWREVQWQPSSENEPFYWRAHKVVSRTPTQATQLGIPLDENLKTALLAHVKVLAERDFTVPN